MSRPTAQQEAELYAAAKAAMQLAHAPYSNFLVGAALRSQHSPVRMDSSAIRDQFRRSITA